MSGQDQRCGTCKWWGGLPETGMGGGLNFNSGMCAYPKNNLPASARTDEYVMLGNEGTTCPCWAPIENGETNG